MYFANTSTYSWSIVVTNWVWEPEVAPEATAELATAMLDAPSAAEAAAALPLLVAGEPASAASSEPVAVAASVAANAAAVEAAHTPAGASTNVPASQDASVVVATDAQGEVASVAVAIEVDLSAGAGDLAAITSKALEAMQLAQGAAQTVLKDMTSAQAAATGEAAPDAPAANTPSVAQQVALTQAVESAVAEAVASGAEGKLTFSSVAQADGSASYFVKNKTDLPESQGPAHGLALGVNPNPNPAAPAGVHVPSPGVPALRNAEAVEHATTESESGADAAAPSLADGLPSLTLLAKHYGGEGGNASAADHGDNGGAAALGRAGEARGAPPGKDAGQQDCSHEARAEPSLLGRRLGDTFAPGAGIELRASASGQAGSAHEAIAQAVDAAVTLGSVVAVQAAKEAKEGKAAGAVDLPSVVPAPDGLSTLAPHVFVPIVASPVTPLDMGSASALAHDDRSAAQEAASTRLGPARAATPAISAQSDALAASVVAPKGRWVAKGFRVETYFTTVIDPVKEETAKQATEQTLEEVYAKERHRKPTRLSVRAPDGSRIDDLPA